MLLWRATKKNLLNVAARNREEHFQSYLSDWLLMLSMKWFCKIPFLDSPYFELKVLIAECVSLESYEKKNLLAVAARNREEHFPSYLSNWIWHYDYNDSAKYHFQIQLISNRKLWCVLPWRATKKNLLTVAGRNREEHFQSYLSDWLWCYHYNDSAKYHFQIHLTSNWKSFDNWVC